MLDQSETTKEELYRKALSYIADRKHMAANSKEPVKWINEFCEVANKALGLKPF